MDSSTFVKQEPIESTISYDHGSTAVNSAFETYINSDFIEDNNISSSTNINAPTIDFDLDVSNSEMMCYFMDSEVLSNNNVNNIPINQLLEQNNLVYLDSQVTSSYSHPTYCAPVHKSEAPSKKKTPGSRKTFPKSTPSTIPEKNGDSSNFRPDLILSPDEMELIAKANPKERRQIRNKISARNFRLRRKEYVTDLEQRASRFDEDSSLLQEVILKNENETVHLTNCIEDLLKKFKLVTSSFSDLHQFKGLDPINDIAITFDGKLSRTSPVLNQEPLKSCRELSNFDGRLNSNENISEGNLGSIFPSRSRTLMVKA